MDCSVQQQPSYYYEMVKPYRDKFGLITQDDFDGGDTAHRTGLFYIGLYLNYREDNQKILEIKKNFRKELDKIEIERGKFVRHPDQTMWYSNPNNFSRDQSTPMITALGFFDEKESIKGNFFQIVKTFGFYPNKLKNWSNKEKVFPLDFRDFVGMSDYGSYIRALKIYPLYPVLMITDSQLLGSALVRFSFSHLDQDDTSDDINFTTHVIQSELIMPTPLSKLAKMIYKLKKKNETHPKESAVFSYWKYYFTHGGRPPLDEIFRCPLDEIIYKNGP